MIFSYLKYLFIRVKYVCTKNSPEFWWKYPEPYRLSYIAFKKRQFWIKAAQAKRKDKTQALDNNTTSNYEEQRAANITRREEQAKYRPVLLCGPKRQA